MIGARNAAPRHPTAYAAACYVPYMSDSSSSIERRPRARGSARSGALRTLFLCLTLPLWLPFRLLGWLGWRARKAHALRVTLSGSLPDVHERRGLVALLQRPHGVSLVRLLETLEVAARDPVITTVLVQIEDLHTGLGRAEEVRAALARLVQAGKRVVVHADELGLAGYWIALGASSIRLSPTGSLDVTGVAMEFTLLSELLDRVGVRAQLLAKGKYKSMREMFTETRISDPNREMLKSLVEDLSGQLVARVAEARSTPLERAREELDRGPFRAVEARERGLIDATEYWDELWKASGGESHGVIELSSYTKLSGRRRLWPARAAHVALLHISGNIRSGHDRRGAGGAVATGHRSLGQALRRARKSRRIRAVVLRVDSPGGSALASDLMWRELTLTAAEKPLFVSMANVAASGGYYASGVKGATVWANPTTLTGSIGVVGGKFEVSGLLSRLGIGRESVASGPRANFHSATTPWTEEELGKLDRDLDALYRDFVTKMAAARGMSFEALHAVAQGRVWTGRQALEARLVDHLGGMHDVTAAVRDALELAPEIRLRWSAPAARRSLGRRSSAEAELTERALAAIASEWPELATSIGRALDLRGERVLALCPIALQLADR